MLLNAALEQINKLLYNCGYLDFLKEALAKPENQNKSLCLNSILLILENEKSFVKVFQEAGLFEITKKLCDDSTCKELVNKILVLSGDRKEIPQEESKESEQKQETVQKSTEGNTGGRKLVNLKKSDFMRY